MAGARGLLLGAALLPSGHLLVRGEEVNAGVLRVCRGARCREQQVSGSGAQVCVEDTDRPVWWLQPFTIVRLHLIPDANYRSQQAPGEGWKVHLRRIPPRWFCEVLEKNIPNVPQKIPMLCQECEDDRCPVAPIPLHQSSELVVPLPSRGGCLLFSQLPENAKRIRVEFRSKLDPRVLAMAGAGYMLTTFWLPLRESRTFHAILGATASVLFITLFVILYVYRELRRTASGVLPAGGILLLFSTMLPSVREALWTWALPSSQIDWMAWLSMRDPWYNLPVGWIASGCATLITVCVVMIGAQTTMNFFAAAPDPENQVVDFVIGPDGRRVDILPPAPFPQKFLGWVLWVLGLVCLFKCTHTDWASAAFALLVVLQGSIIHNVREALRWMTVMTPRHLREPISREMYEKQGRFQTAHAIQALQQHIRRHPELLRSVKEESELRLRRFTDGGQHFQRPYEDIDEPRPWCSLL